MFLVTPEFGFTHRFAPYVICLYDGYALATGVAEQIFRDPQKRENLRLYSAFLRILFLKYL